MVNCDSCESLSARLLPSRFSVRSVFWLEGRSLRLVERLLIAVGAASKDADRGCCENEDGEDDHGGDCLAVVFELPLTDGEGPRRDKHAHQDHRVDEEGLLVAVLTHGTFPSIDETN